MNPRFRHLLEKIQVQLTAAAAAVLACLVGWPFIRPWDPHGALAFVPEGQWLRLLIFAAEIWVLAAGCAVLTISARPEGALLTALVGAAGLCWRRGAMRTLLWRWEGDLGRLFSLLAVEVLALGAVLLGAVIVIAAVRALARRIRPGWVWSEPAPEPSRGNPSPSAAGSAPRAPWYAQGLLWELLRSLRGRSRPGEATLVNVAGCLLMELAIAVVLLVVTFRSADHGQIAFALVVSFLVAAFVADYVFAVRSAVPAWLGPLLLGALVFALGRAPTAGEGPAWHAALHVAGGLPLRAALPVDWFSLGCSGAVAGFWLSRRLRHSDRLDKQEAAAKSK